MAIVVVMVIVIGAAAAVVIIRPWTSASDAAADRGPDKACRRDVRRAVTAVKRKTGIETVPEKYLTIDLSATPPILVRYDAPDTCLAYAKKLKDPLILAPDVVIDADQAAVACTTEKRTVRTAEEAYNAQQGTYPTTVDQLTFRKSYLEVPPVWSIVAPNGVVRLRHGAPAGC